MSVPVWCTYFERHLVFMFNEIWFRFFWMNFYLTCLWYHFWHLSSFHQPATFWVVLYWVSVTVSLTPAWQRSPSLVGGSINWKSTGWFRSVVYDVHFSPWPCCLSRWLNLFICVHATVRGLSPATVHIDKVTLLVDSGFGTWTAALLLAMFGPTQPTTWTAVVNQ